MDIAVLTHALEEDSGVMEDLKREVDEFQEKELNTSQQYLANLRKRYVGGGAAGPMELDQR